MGKAISDQEYQEARHQLSSCADKACKNCCRAADGYCKYCIKASKTAREYERTRRLPKHNAWTPGG